MALVSNERAKIIDQYLEEHKDAKTRQTTAVVLAGEKKVLDVYKFPIDLLLYNKKNGRLASVVAKYQREHGAIDSTTDKGKKIVIEMLLNLDNVRTEDLSRDIERVGQLEPGIITHDGLIINANRRMAILRRLYERGKGEKYNYVLASRLPPNVTEKDIFRIEAGLQYGEDFKAKYGPINELLTIKRGLTFYTKEQMANDVLMLPKGVNELEHKLEVLKYMEEYLNDVGRLGEYDTLKSVYAHFDDVVNLVKYLEKRKSPAKIEQYIEHAFKLIKSNAPHKSIRGLRDIAKIPSVKREDKVLSLGKEIRLNDTKKKTFPVAKKAFRSASLTVFAEAKEELSKKPVSWYFDKLRHYLEVMDTKNSDIKPAKLREEFDKIIDLLKKKRGEVFR